MGGIRIAGLQPDLSALLERRLQQLPVGSPAATNVPAALSVWNWQPGVPSSTDPASMAAFERTAALAMTDLNRYGAEVHVEALPDETLHRIDLIVRVNNPGEEGILDRIDIDGLRLNKKDDVLAFLDLKPGMRMSGNLTNDVLRRLWNSGRFNGHEVHLAPLGQPGRFRLGLSVMEQKDAPLLGREFQEEEKALLRLRDWILDWKNRPVDWVMTFDFRQGGHRILTEIAARMHEALKSVLGGGE